MNPPMVPILVAACTVMTLLLIPSGFVTGLALDSPAQHRVERMSGSQTGLELSPHLLVKRKAHTPSFKAASSTKATFSTKTPAPTKAAVPTISVTGSTTVEIFCTDHRNIEGTFVEDLLCNTGNPASCIYCGCDGVFDTDGHTLPAAVAVTALPKGPGYLYNYTVVSSTGSLSSSYIKVNDAGRFMIGPGQAEVDTTQVIAVTAHNLATKISSAPVDFTFIEHTCSLGLTNNLATPTDFILCQGANGNLAGVTPILAGEAVQFKTSNSPAPSQPDLRFGYGVLGQPGNQPAPDCVNLATADGNNKYGQDTNGNYPMKVVSSSNPTGDLSGYVSVTPTGQLFYNPSYPSYPDGLIQTLRVCVTDNSPVPSSPKIGSPYLNGSMLFTVTFSNRC